MAAALRLLLAFAASLAVGATAKKAEEPFESILPHKAAADHGAPALRGADLMRFAERRAPAGGEAGGGDASPAAASGFLPWAGGGPMAPVPGAFGAPLMAPQPFAVPQPVAVPHPVAVPQPVPVAVDRPYPVDRAVPVDRPVLVPHPIPYPVPVDRPVPVAPRGVWAHDPLQVAMEPIPYPVHVKTTGAPTSVIPDYNHFEPLNPESTTASAAELASHLPPAYTPDMYGNPADYTTEFAGAGVVGRGLGYTHFGAPLGLGLRGAVPSAYSRVRSGVAAAAPLVAAPRFERVTLPNGMHMNVPHDPAVAAAAAPYHAPFYGHGYGYGAPFHPGYGPGYGPGFPAGAVGAAGPRGVGGYLPTPMHAALNPEGPGPDVRSAMYYHAQERIQTEQARATAAMRQAQHDSKLRESQLEDLKMQSDEIQAEMQQAVRAVHKERTYIADMSRRVAALDVDKHRLDLRSKLDDLMGQYNRAEEQQREQQDELTKASSVKTNLIKTIHSTKENLRNSMNVITKLINDKGPDKEVKEDEVKAEKAEREAEELAAKARELQAKADSASDSANQQFVANAEAGTLGHDYEVIGGSGAGASGAGTPRR